MNYFSKSETQRVYFEVQELVEKAIDIAGMAGCLAIGSGILYGLASLIIPLVQFVQASS